MTIRIGINGFGRIGRLVARALHEYNIQDVELVAINSPGAIETSAHLLRYDSVHGRFNAEVVIDNGHLKYGTSNVRMTHERSPENVNWADVGVDVLMECSGRFRTRDAVLDHMKAGAKSVLIFCASKWCR